LSQWAGRQIAKTPAIMWAEQNGDFDDSYADYK
jgi:hypothetical protein